MYLLFLTLFVVLVKNGASQIDFHKLHYEIVNRVGNGDTALRMLDASARSLPSGIFKGNFYNFGSYDACLSIKEDKIQGKYCYGTLSISKIFNHLHTEQQNVLHLFNDVNKRKKNSTEEDKPEISDETNLLGFHFGICVPNSAKIEEFVPFVNFDESYCYSEDRKLETKHWIALGVIAVIVGIALVSTICDGFFYFIGSKPHTAVVAFSVYSNGQKLFKSSTNENQLLCINGLRTINMMWVILGHTYVNMALSGSLDNWFDLADWMDDPKSMTIIGGTIAVDSFFAIGGLLTTYLYMKGPDRDLKECAISVPLMYIHRYLRLTPALAIMILVYATGLINFLGDGPKWGLLQHAAVEGCEDKWYTTLLYFQNYIKGSEEMCIAQSWYLAVDMQLFLLSPLILIPLKKWPKIVIPIKVILIGLGVAIPFYIGYSNNFNGLLLGSTTPTSINEYYTKTHARFGPYVIGMLAGYVIYKMKEGKRELKLNVIISSILWLITIGILIACIFDGYKLMKENSNAVMDGLYLGLNRSIWSCALSLLIILCVSGNGGPINTFLSLPVMQLLSKLSYSMYLVHYLLILVVNYSSRSTMHFSNIGTIFTFFGYFIITAVVSIAYTLLFESPFIILDRLIFSRWRSS